MSNSATSLASDIEAIISDIHQECKRGAVAFIGIVAVYDDGSSRRAMTGSADSFLLIGLFEYLKVKVLQQEMAAAGTPQVDTLLC